MLVDHRVTRMPSVHFLFAHWKSLVDDPASIVNVGIDRQSVFYILNPDSDLMNTQKTFESWFSRFALANMSSYFRFGVTACLENPEMSGNFTAVRKQTN